jgi:hypothetical protein
LNEKTGGVVQLPSNFLSIKDKTITLNSKNIADVGTYDYLLRVSLLLYPTVYKEIKMKVIVAMDCSSTSLKLTDPSSVSDFSST